jgi:mRNA-degrading endonuclease RelE of RelBE toxin-antitoxin system
LDDLRSLRRYDRQKVVDAIEQQLAYQPNEASRNRKRLRPNQLAEWELRIGSFRVFYDSDTSAKVTVVAVGYKRANQLFIRGQEYTL